MVTEKIRSPKFEINSIKEHKIAELFKLEPLENSFDYCERYSPITRVIKFVCRGFPNKFAIFDAETLNIKKFSYNYNKELNCDGFGCLIPHGSLFYAWNDTWIIIDPLGNSRNITPYAICYHAGAIYFDGKIYIFGGSHEVAVKFDMDKNRWFSLSKYSFSIENRAFCTLFKTKILIASSSENPIFYDTITDSYSEILPIKLSPKVHKQFFAVGEKVFLFEFSKFIYESDDDLMTWNNIGECSLIKDYAVVCGYPICYKEIIYIATYQCAYSFDLKEKKLKEAKIFEKSLMDHHSFWYNG
ncbi:unnamed protein product [Blepharisma stoltei]|uniref:Uncharacterized protein n=1 Tax=Blepharisma stoltei TaxID=1481888 RepID=A0AAU9IJT0_9CILI|nr:unnamed protein product [Blepharisma stoltei]